MSSGYAVAIGPCWACKAIFAFDPELVPSLPVARCEGCGAQTATDVPLKGECTDGAPHRLGEAVREPICATCVHRANVNRRRSGLPLIEVLPGAYPAVGGP